MRAMRSILWSAILGTLGATGCARLLTESRLLRPPPPRSEFSTERLLIFEAGDPDTQAPRRVLAEPAEVISPDGTRLRGWYFSHPQHRRYLMFLHGSLGVMERSERFLGTLCLLLDTNILAIDYRGYGYSEGRASLEALADDALLVYDDLARRASHPDDPVFIFGYSLGSALACHVAAQRDAAGVILLAPFTCADDFCATAGPWWFRAFNRVRPDEPLRRPRQPIDNVRDVREPLLIVHGTEDIVTRVELGRRMRDAAGSKLCRMIEVPGAGHENIRLTAPALARALREFVAEACALRKGHAPPASIGQ
ncbi:MAG: alpha/beta fold hydrolase [Planctomycetia bacterium]|nr:MAG: alpha/beta fold hydrolase [Planctomycetia bacterium]